MKQKWLLALVLFFSACQSQTTSTPTNTTETHPELKNIPIYLENTSWVLGIPGIGISKDIEFYSYITNVYKMETLVTFYEENMPSYGWELFEKMETEIDNMKGTTLLFSKGTIIAQLEIVEWTVTSKLVSVNFYSSP